MYLFNVTPILLQITSSSKSMHKHNQNQNVFEKLNKFSENKLLYILFLIHLAKERAARNKLSQEKLKKKNSKKHSFFSGVYVALATTLSFNYFKKSTRTTQRADSENSGKMNSSSFQVNCCLCSFRHSIFDKEFNVVFLFNLNFSQNFLQKIYFLKQNVV